MLGNQNPEVAISLQNLGNLLAQSGRVVDAEGIFRESLAIYEKNSPDGSKTAYARGLLGANLVAQKKYSEAGPLLVSAYQALKPRLETLSAPNKSRFKEVLEQLIEYYQALGNSETAARYREELAEFK